jgi:hypothetical protein
LFSPFGEIVSTKVMVRHFFFFAWVSFVVCYAFVWRWRAIVDIVWDLGLFLSSTDQLHFFIFVEFVSPV